MLIQRSIIKENFDLTWHCIRLRRQIQDVPFLNQFICALCPFYGPLDSKVVCARTHGVLSFKGRELNGYLWPFTFDPVAEWRMFGFQALLEKPCWSGTARADDTCFMCSTRQR